MEAIRDIITPRPPEAGRWAICIALALGVHAAVAGILLSRWSSAPEQVANAPLIMIDLEPVPVAPEAKPTHAPPGPLQPQATAEPEQPKPLEKAAEPAVLPKLQEAQPVAPRRPENAVTLLPAPQGEMVTSALPPPKPIELTVETPADRPVQKMAEKPVEKVIEKPIERKHHPRRASLASAPSAAGKRAERAAAPAPGAASRNPNALPSWKSELVARLERFKRYPPEAEARGEHGVAQLAFSVDRRGGVHHPRIAHSSGSSLLDSATLAMVEKAAPMPPPPAELAGAQIAISVPIRYDAR